MTHPSIGPRNTQHNTCTYTRGMTKMCTRTTTTNVNMRHFDLQRNSLSLSPSHAQTNGCDQSSSLPDHVIAHMHVSSMYTNHMSECVERTSPITHLWPISTSFPISELFTTVLDPMVVNLPTVVLPPREDAKTTFCRVASYMHIDTAYIQRLRQCLARVFCA